MEGSEGMASTFYGLNIAYTGLTAANAGLNTTANNISNVNTEGYSRQLVEQNAVLQDRPFLFRRMPSFSNGISIAVSM